MPLAGGGIQGEGGPAPGWMLGPEEEGGDRKHHVNLEGKTGGGMNGKWGYLLSLNALDFKGL